MTTPIQFLLILLLAGIGLIAFARQGKPLVSRTVVITFVVLGVFCVLKPELTTRLAHFLGVGRGTDLVIYLGGLTFVYLLLLIHLRMVKYERNLRTVIRELAIRGAQSPQEKQESSHNFATNSIPDES